MLEVFDLSVNCRGIQVLDAVSLSLQSGEWVGLIGPNGAGKSTLENIQQAYGSNIQPAVEGSHSEPFVC